MKKWGFHKKPLVSFKCLDGCSGERIASGDPAMLEVEDENPVQRQK
jgi:hypothetical protein